MLETHRLFKAPRRGTEDDIMTASATATRAPRRVTLRLISGGKTDVEIPSDSTVDHATKEIVREFELPKNGSGQQPAAL